MKKLILLLIIALTACNKPPKEQSAEKSIQAVSTAAVEVKTFHELVSSSGMLSSKAEVKLAFKTGGLIEKSYVNEGQYVRQGQLLAELDLSEIKASVNQAQIGFEKSKRDFERAEKLFQDEAVTKATLNDAKSGLDVATQVLNAAQFNQKLSKIYASSSGRILKKLAEKGELIGPFVPMFVLGDGSQAYIVTVGLTDRDIIKVSLGDKAEVELDAYPNEIFEGHVTQISQMINLNTGTFDIEVEIEPKGKTLKSGFIAKVKVYTKSTESALSVPIEALVNANDKLADVYVYSGGKTHKRAITIGQIHGKFVTVTSGLKLGEMIITRGSGFVSEGDSVKVYPDLI